jgi:predicted O-methyltransferase YrrM
MSLVRVSPNDFAFEGGSKVVSRGAVGIEIKSAMRMVGLFGLNVIRNPDLVNSAIPVALHPLTSAWDAEEPWWNSRAIKYLAKQLPTEGEAFEWGSGSSTIWLSTHSINVTSVESESEWAKRVRERCADALVRLIPAANSGTMRSEPQLRDHGNHFFDDYVNAIDDYADRSFDLIIVDGVCRAECARRAATKIKPGGLVVVDDTNWRFLDSCFEPFRTWETKRIRGFKHMSPDVWETTFFRRSQ